LITELLNSAAIEYNETLKAFCFVRIYKAYRG